MVAIFGQHTTAHFDSPSSTGRRHAESKDSGSQEVKKAELAHGSRNWGGSADGPGRTKVRRIAGDSVIVYVGLTSVTRRSAQ
jgi:hypothetical protein